MARAVCKRARTSALSGVAALFVILVSRGALAATPVEILGHLPSTEDVVISPDGDELAYVRTAGDDREAVIMELATGKPRLAVGLGQTKLRRLIWADHDHLLALLTTTERPMGIAGMRAEWASLLVIDIPARKIFNPLDGFVTGLVTYLNAIGSSPVIRVIHGETSVFMIMVGMAGDATNGEIGAVMRPCLIQLDLKSGKAHLVANSTAGAIDWVIDETGSVVAEEHYDATAKRWSVLAMPSGRVLASGEAPIDVPELGGLSADGSGLWMRLSEGEHTEWRQLQLQDGTWKPVPEAYRHAEALHVGRLTGRVVGASFLITQSRGRLRFLDPHWQDVWQAVLNATPTLHPSLISAADDFNSVVVQVDGLASGPMYLLADVPSGQTKPLASVYSGLTQTGTEREITYHAQDGLEVPGFLTLPPGRPAHKLPLVVLPHGGPVARDTGDFDWLAQAFALQGYAVLQPNFRGSLLGEEFESAGYGEWGRKMQTDLSDGVAALSAQGTIDPTRVCIVGASYGGYAALAGVTLQSGIYRCAVADAGISDLQAFLSWVHDKTNNPLADRYFLRLLGVQNASDPKLSEISPIKHLPKQPVPILLIHGRDDTVVPFSQSEAFQAAMRQQHLPVTLVELQQEDHWLSRTATRFQMLQAAVDFVRTNNPPDEVPAP